MRNLDEITARGSGAWGAARYEIELITNTRTWSDSQGLRSRSLTEWHLNVCASQVGRRRFQSGDERQRFIHSSFTDLDLIDIVPAERHERPHALHELLGQQLSSVWFVWDYVQLRFDEPPVNVYAMPAIQLADGGSLRPGDLGYADALVGQIGATLTESDELLDLGLILKFDNGVQLAVPLGEAPFPEAAGFDGRESGRIWITGEAPWERHEEERAPG